MLLSLKSSVVAAVTALSIGTIPAAPAFAWGDREQGFVAGVAAAIIIDEILKDGRKKREAKRAPAPAPIYVEPVRTSIYSTPAARAFNSYSRAERKAIQRSLRASGYYYGGIDGSFGPGTYNAVVAYARDYGASGNLSSNGGAFAIYDGLIY
jgi:hypothetical protein